MPFLSERPVTQTLVVFFAVFLPTLVLTPAAANPTAALQSVMLQILLVASVPLAFAHLSNLDKRTTLSLGPVTAKNLLWCLLLAFSVLFLLDEIVLWQQQLTGVRASLSPEIQQLLRADSALQLVWIFFALALTPAICEELLFRGFILGTISGDRTARAKPDDVIPFVWTLPSQPPRTSANNARRHHARFCRLANGQPVLRHRHACLGQQLGHCRDQFKTRGFPSLDTPAQPRAGMAPGSLCVGGCSGGEATATRTTSWGLRERFSITAWSHNWRGSADSSNLLRRVVTNSGVVRWLVEDRQRVSVSGYQQSGNYSINRQDRVFSVLMSISQAPDRCTRPSHHRTR